jgi:hypothetical protein
MYHGSCAPSLQVIIDESALQSVNLSEASKRLLTVEFRTSAGDADGDWQDERKAEALGQVC